MNKVEILMTDWAGYVSYITSQLILDGTIKAGQFITGADDVSGIIKFLISDCNLSAIEAEIKLTKLHKNVQWMCIRKDINYYARAD